MTSTKPPTRCPRDSDTPISLLPPPWRPPSPSSLAEAGAARRYLELLHQRRGLSGGPELLRQLGRAGGLRGQPLPAAQQHLPDDFGRRFEADGAAGAAGAGGQHPAPGWAVALVELHPRLHLGEVGQGVVEAPSAVLGALGARSRGIPRPLAARSPPGAQGPRLPAGFGGHRRGRRFLEHSGSVVPLGYRGVPGAPGLPAGCRASGAGGWQPCAGCVGLGDTLGAGVIRAEAQGEAPSRGPLLPVPPEGVPGRAPVPVLAGRAARARAGVRQP